MKRPSWWQPPIESGGIHHGCVCCSTAAQIAPMDMHISVGFGVAHVTKDGEIVWMESADDDFGDCPTVAEMEELAAASPDHDWRITKFGPLHGETFQRHGPERWVCIESNPGFA